MTINCPEGKAITGLKWVYKTKVGQDGKLQKHKARLMVKGYARKPGVDFNEAFAFEQC